MNRFIATGGSGVRGLGLATVFTVLLLAGCVSRPGTETRRFDRLVIRGTPRFDGRIDAALTLLRARSPGGYETITNYIGIIQENEHSGMAADENPPVFQLNARSAFKSLTWCAGDIAHDSFHSKLYHDYLKAHGGPVPDGVWTGHEAERQCLQHQTQVLIEIGAPAPEVERCRTISPDYADVPYTNRNW